MVHLRALGGCNPRYLPNCIVLRDIVVPIDNPIATDVFGYIIWIVPLRVSIHVPRCLVDAIWLLLRRKGIEKYRCQLAANLGPLGGCAYTGLTFFARSNLFDSPDSKDGCALEKRLSAAG